MRTTGSRAMMRLGLLVALIGILEPGSSAADLYFTPDIPTGNPEVASGLFLPWDVVLYCSTAIPSFQRVLQLPAGTPLDALHKMDRPGRWLFSVDNPVLLPPDPVGAQATLFQPEDLFLYNDSVLPPSYAMYFDGSLAGVPAGSNVDAVFLAGGDEGLLILSFGGPTTIDDVTYEPADLVQYVAGEGFSMFLDASSAGGGISVSTDLEGADQCGTSAAGLQRPVGMALDIPADLSPSVGRTTYLRGQVASWDGMAYRLFVELPGWPQSSIVRSISCEAGPGSVYDPRLPSSQIRVDRSMVSEQNIVIRWPASCSSGSRDYFIYEGTLSSLRTGYNHRKKICTDTGHDLMEEITPQPGNSYYLVVPFNGTEEGSYGTNSLGAQRPQPASASDRCAALQDTTPCPP